MFRIVSSRTTRLTLAPLLALWIAGTGCLFGCEIKSLAAEPVSQHESKSTLATMVSGEACASAKSHDCCANKPATKHGGHDTEKVAGENVSSHELVVWPGSSSGSMGSCPLAVNATVVVTKSRDTETSAGTASTVVVPHQRILRHQTHRSDPLSLPNRGHTYLRCCVFLI